MYICDLCVHIASQIGITIFVDCGVWERRCGKTQMNDKKVDSKTKVQPIEDNKHGSDEKMNNNDDDIKSWGT